VCDDDDAAFTPGLSEAEMRVIAIDWSGALSGARRRITLAEVVGRRLVRLDRVRDREAVTRHLIDESGRTPGMLVGLDFAFSFPAWFLRERGLETVRDLWALASVEAESWIAACEPPFWGKPGRPRPADLRDDERAFRRTERSVPPVGGIRPKSVFQIGGAGAVGTGSLRGMPLLDRLAGAGFSIWPFDPPALPRVVEIYPRILTGAVNKSSLPDRMRHLLAYVAASRVEVEPSLLDESVASEDAFDAVISAFEMARHAEEIASLPESSDPSLRLEGSIWSPRSPKVEDPSTRAAAATPSRDTDVEARRPAAALHGAAASGLPLPAPAPAAQATRPPETGREPANAPAPVAAEPSAGSPEAVVRAFIARINAHDPSGLAALMTEGHVFVDARGATLADRDAVRQGWESFFLAFPDYRIDAADIFSGEGGVAVFGFASGGYRESGGQEARRWRIPAAWRAAVAGGKVVEWQVYCDTAWADRSQEES
jgi:ketosteroid isomerase-like protein